MVDGLQIRKINKTTLSLDIKKSKEGKIVIKVIMIALLKLLLATVGTKYLCNSQHTRSSWADFNHGLVVRPQGCQGCQKIQKNVLQINLLS